MKNEKYSNIPPLVENDITINDSLAKSNLLNGFFASKSSVIVIQGFFWGKRIGIIKFIKNMS